MNTNFWLGGEYELVIIYSDGTHHVLDSDKDYNVVFNGSYKKCLEYCERCQNEYMESIIG